jgi:hypothetical protein
MNLKQINSRIETASTAAGISNYFIGVKSDINVKGRESETILQLIPFDFPINYRGADSVDTILQFILYDKWVRNKTDDDIVTRKDTWSDTLELLTTFIGKLDTLENDITIDNVEDAKMYDDGETIDAAVAISVKIDVKIWCNV